MQEIRLSVEGMSCNHCVFAISGSLHKLGATATVDLASGSVAIKYDPGRLSLEEIEAVIEEQGYQATGII